MMDRVAAKDYLINRWPKLIAAAGVVADDTPEGFGPAIDDSLLVLGFKMAELPTAEVDDDLVLEYRALLRYNGLTILEANLADPDHLSYNVKGDGGIEELQSNLLKQCQRLLAAAKKEIEERGLAANSSLYGSFVLNMYEPGYGGDL